MALCLAEGARRTGKDRLHLYRVAAGSAAEVRAALAVGRAWGWIGSAALAPAEALLDRVLAMLWRLTHPGSARRPASYDASARIPEVATTASISAPASQSAALVQGGGATSCGSRR